ncbi:MAG: MarR family transcriptional regulator [Selenomonadaceae bacterium]|nr:MarR family transcriptional regulator [Selenomonadaceae bacterium]
MDKKSDLTNIFLETNHLLHRYNMMWYGKNFGGLDPRQGQGRILTALRRMNSVSQKDLGFILDIRPQSLGELLQKLENSGYIQRRRSTTDKRALIVELTEKGETFQLQKPDYEELFITLNSEEKKILKRALEKIFTQLSEQIQKEAEDDFY